MENDYERVASFESLYQAHLAARKNKRYKQGVMAFEADLTSNLWRIKDALDAQTYQVAGYHHFKVFDPKTRDIQALTYPDRVVQHSLCDNVVAPVLERHLIFDNAACRIGKGTSFAMDRLSAFLRDHYRCFGNQGYVLKADITKYFASINHGVLKGMVAGKFADPKTERLLNIIIDSYNAQAGRGLPMGNQTSQWFALLYLDKMDRLIKEKLRIKHYTRYMDDMVLVHESKDHLKVCLTKMERTAADLKLTFNDKTHIFPLRNGVEYVGWRFCLTDTGKVIRRVRSSTKCRMRKNIARLKNDYVRQLTDQDKIVQHKAAICGYLQLGNTGRMRERLCTQIEDIAKAK